MAIRVFVSYRRRDSGADAGRLRDRLVREFGARNVFFDVYTMEAGEHFPTVIRKRLASADAVVAVIGPRYALERLAEGEDYVRLELLEAFEQAKFVIPVLVDNAEMPTPEQLPAELQPLTTFQAARVRPDPDFDTDADRLIERIRRRVDEDHEPQRRRRARVAATICGLTLLAAVVVAVAVLAPGGDDDTADTTLEPGTSGASTSASATTGATSREPDRLIPDGRLTAREALTSPNGRHTLEMTADGLLVATSNGSQTWRAPYAPEPRAVAVMQPDGNLVVYRSARAIAHPKRPGNVLFASETMGNPDAYLVVGDDGVVNIQSAEGAILKQLAPVEPGGPHATVEPPVSTPSPTPSPTTATTPSPTPATTASPTPATTTPSDSTTVAFPT